MNPAQKHLVPLGAIEPEGRTIIVDDRSVWSGPASEFGMDCRFDEGPVAEVLILPTDEGWLLRGRLTATVTMPCSRCAGETRVELDERFEDYANRPESDEDGESKPSFEDGDDHVVSDRGVLCLDLAATCWEQFALALPPHPLCREDCKGLCPRCGKDLNEGPCSCAEPEGDPRLAVLRGLKVKKK